MKRLILAATLGLTLATGAAAAAPRQPARAPLDLADPLRDKLLYLFRLIDRSPDAREAVAGDTALTGLRLGYVAQLSAAEAGCGALAACYATAAHLTPEEITAGEQGLRRLYVSSPPLRTVVDHDLAASGIASASDDGVELLAAAWREHVAAMARILDTFAAGLPPQFPLIDGPAEDPKSPAFAQRLRLTNAVVIEASDRPQPFYDPPADYAELLLHAEGRDEAGRHEPLETGENAAALRRLKSTDWKRFPYTAIIVPGAGPEREGERLTGVGKLRLQLAVLRWRAGKAPFLLVSGGYVHPARTPFAEAIEMKRYLIETLKVPEGAILIDPHARHTTTNLRNAARILWRDGAPVDRKMLVVSDEGQSAYMASAAFDMRNRAETGVLPYSQKKQLGRFEVEILPAAEALRLNPLDPLDP
jgi:hypothetical protein